MKYAFIALIAIYLVIYGCSPDDSDKATDSHEQKVLTAVENSQKSVETVAPVIEHEPANATKQPEEIVADDTSKQTPAIVEEKRSAEVADQTDPILNFKVVEQAPAVVEEGNSAEVADQTDPILNFKVVEQAPGEQIVEPEQAVMPCGRIMARSDIPENAPCLDMQPRGTQNAATTAGNEQELTDALQKMLDTTNDMVLATRQLVIATQELLDANKKAEKETQPAQQKSDGQAPAPPQQ